MWRDIMLLLRQVMTAVPIFMIATLLLVATFASNVGATPILNQTTNSVKTTMDFALSWQALPDATAYQVRVSRDEALLQTDQEDDSVWHSLWIDTTELPFASIAETGDGDWFWQVRSRDTAGNMSGWSEVRRLTVDTTAPEVIFIKPDNSAYSTTVDLQLSIKDTCTDGRCIIKLDDVDITSQLQVEFQDDGTMFAGIIAIDMLSKGEHVFLAMVSDEHGNKTEQTKSFTVDNTTPIVTTPINEDEGYTEGIASLVDVESTDPLLEQLSRQLSQPLVESTVLQDKPVNPGSPAQSVNSRLHINQDERPALRDEPARSLVAPSEDGWRIFGIVWYWWFCAMIVGAIAYRRRRVAVALSA